MATREAVVAGAVGLSGTGLIRYLLTPVSASYDSAVSSRDRALELSKDPATLDRYQRNPDLYQKPETYSQHADEITNTELADTGSIINLANFATVVCLILTAVAIYQGARIKRS